LLEEIRVMERKKKIMIIDDEEDFCHFVKMNLEATRDFEVTICCNSGEAFGEVTRQQPDLVLLDIMMPGENGADIAERLKDNDNTHDIPIVFLTALARKEEAARGTIGGRYFIAKPVGTEELISTIKRIVP
jgi:CheY-like chemotaxis protein